MHRSTSALGSVGISDACISFISFRQNWFFLFFIFVSNIIVFFFKSCTKKKKKLLFLQQLKEYLVPPNDCRLLMYFSPW